MKQHLAHALTATARTLMHWAGKLNPPVQPTREELREQVQYAHAVINARTLGLTEGLQGINPNLTEMLGKLTTIGPNPKPSIGNSWAAKFMRGLAEPK